MTKISDYLDVRQRAVELGLSMPDGIAILPRNFTSAMSREELLHEDTVPTIRSLLRDEARVYEVAIDTEGSKIPYIKERSSDWVGPILLIGAAIFTENPHAISIALNVISTYLTDYFRGQSGTKIVKLGIVIPQPRTEKYIKIDYEGDVSGLLELNEIIKELRNGRNLGKTGRKRT